MARPASDSENGPSANISACVLEQYEANKRDSYISGKSIIRGQGLILKLTPEDDPHMEPCQKQTQVFEALHFQPKIELCHGEVDVQQAVGETIARTRDDDEALLVYADLGESDTVTMDDITRPFIACPTLAGKAKIFFFEITSSKATTQDLQDLINVEDDDVFVYVCCLIPPSHGSNPDRFVNTFISVIQSLAKSEHLDKLAEILSNRMHDTSRETGRYLCAFSRSGRFHKCYFFPGMPNLTVMHEECPSDAYIKQVLSNIYTHWPDIADKLNTDSIVDDLFRKKLITGEEKTRFQGPDFGPYWCHLLLGIFSRKTSQDLKKIIEYLLSSKLPGLQTAGQLLQPWPEGKLRAFLRVTAKPPAVLQRCVGDLVRFLGDPAWPPRQELSARYDVSSVTTNELVGGVLLALAFPSLETLEHFVDDTKRDTLPGQFTPELDFEFTLQYNRSHSLRALVKVVRDRSEVRESTAVADTAGSGADVREPPVNVLHQALIRIIFPMISSKEYSFYDFEKVLHGKVKSGSLPPVAELKNERGMTVMHYICEQNQLHYLQTLVRMGLWSALKGEVVPATPGERCSEKTARQIAESVTRSRKLVLEVDEMERWDTSLNRLMKAAREGNERSVDKIARDNPRMKSERDWLGCSALYWACVSGKPKVVERLARDGNARALNKKNETLLHITCIMGHDELVSTLVDIYHVDVDARDVSSKTALDYTAERGDIECLRKLLHHGVLLTPNVNLHAAYFGRRLFLQELFNNHSVDLTQKGEHGKTALMRAAEASKSDVIGFILDKVAVNWQESDDRRRTVLHYAAEGGDVRALQALLTAAQQAGVLADVINAQDIYVGSELCFLIRGKDKGRRAWHYVEVRRSLVHTFVKKTRSGSVDVALFGKVVKSGWGTDPEGTVMDELENRFRHRIRQMEIQGENVPSDVTPLHIACYKEHVDATRTLLDMGADPNVQDSFGLTALHIAAMRGNVQLVQLLEGKADTTIESLDNKTPAQVAEENEHPAIVNFIRGRNYVQNSLEFIVFLESIKEEFTQGRLDQLRSQGSDVRRHLVDNLRDITIRVNEFLLSMGSGPVVEESMPYQQASQPTGQ